MPEVIRVIRRPHKEKVATLPVSRTLPWNRTVEDIPCFEPVNLRAREQCVGCGEPMTVARLIAWVRDGKGTQFRQGPVHPGCRERAQDRYPRNTLVFKHPNDLGKATG